MSIQDPAIAELYRRWIEGGNADGDSEAFVRASRSSFTSIVRRVAGNFGGCQPHEVEDQLQEIYLKLFVQGPSMLPKMPKDPEQAHVYLRILAANVCRDLWKAKRADCRSSDRTVPFSGVEGRLSTLGLSEVESDLTLQKIYKLLTDRRERTVFGLYFRQGFSAAEIAKIKEFGLSVKGVESLIFRITSRLREALRNSKKEGNSGESSS